MATNGTNEHGKNYETRLFINNEYVKGSSEKQFSVTNPADESTVVDNVEAAGAKEIDEAVKYSQNAFKTTWGKKTAAERAAVMHKFADIIGQHVDELAQIEAISMGQPVSVVKWIIKMLCDCFRYYAGWTDKVAGETYPTESDGTYRLIRYDPIGVCAGVGAWNVSYMLFAMKTAPCVAMGNTMIYKSSEKSPLGILALGKYIVEAGFPPGTVQLVSGAGLTGSLLASHMDIRKISFTGSATTGRKIQEAAAKSNLKRVTLELGGKSPALVFKDANLENAIQHCSQGFLLNSSQACIATSRTFVQEEIADQFIEGVRQAFEGIGKTIGTDPLDEKTFQGPLVDKLQFDRVMQYMEAGKKEAKMIVGGEKVGDKGFYVQPTIFLNPDDNAKIYREEIFGPLLAIRTFKTEEEAIRLANDTNYGLSATLFTDSASRALRVADAIEAGTVGVNMSFIPSVAQSFGGFKESGVGREGGKEACMYYLQSKSIAINLNA